MKLFAFVAGLSVIALTGCRYDYDCPYTKHTASILGAIEITESRARYDEDAAWWREVAAFEPDAGPDTPRERRVQHLGPSTQGQVDLDDACPAAAWGCVRVGTEASDGLTFRRPSQAGTFALRDLGAKVCEVQAALVRNGRGSESIHCAEVDGQLIVHEVAAERLDADLVIAPRAEEATAPSITGSAHLVVHDEVVDNVCTGGGIGRVPGFGPE